MKKGKNNVDCVDVKSDGVEGLLKLLFTTAISIIIVLTVISISVAGIQYMTEQATGQIKGGAKKRLTNSFVALALGLLSYTILYTINKQLVNFTFNPASIDKDGSIAKGAADAEAARSAGTFSSSLGGIEPLVTGITPPYATGPVSPTGYVNIQTGAPCTPVAGVPDSLNPCVSQKVTVAAGNFGSWSESAADAWVLGLPSGPRSTDGRLVISVYSKTGDSVTDSGTAGGRGNADNLLREGSVALSPNLVARYHPQVGQEIFINGTSVGFFEDTSDDDYQGTPIVNTVDIYDENKTMGSSILKNIQAGQWNITFGSNKRPQIPNPSPKK
jgi:hypothetical protein